MNKQNLSIVVTNYTGMEKNPFLNVDSEGELSTDNKAKTGSDYLDYYSEFFKLSASGKDSSTRLDDIYDTFFGSQSKRQETVEFIFNDFIPNVLNQNIGETVSSIVLQHDPLFRIAHICNQLDIMRNGEQSYQTDIANILKNTNEATDTRVKNLKGAIKDDSGSTRINFKPVEHLIALYEIRENSATSILEKRILALAEIHIEYLFFYVVLLCISYNDQNKKNSFFYISQPKYQDVLNKYASNINDSVIINSINNKNATVPNVTTSNGFIQINVNSPGDYSGNVLSNDNAKNAIKTRFAIQTVIDILQAIHKRMYNDEWAIAYLRSETQDLGNKIEAKQSSIQDEEKSIGKQSQYLATMRDKEQNQVPKLRAALVYMIIYIVLGLLFVGVNVAYLIVFSDNGSMTQHPWLGYIAQTPHGRSNILIIANLCIIAIIFLVRFIQTIRRRERRTKR